MLPITSHKRNHCKTETDKKDSTVPAKSITTKRKASELSTAIPLNAKKNYPTRGIPICSKKSVKQKDIGLYFESIEELSDVERYNLMTEVSKPPFHFNFPKTTEAGKPRRFNNSWLEQFDWLVYSQYLDGCFCLPCVLFGSKLKEHISSKLSSL